MSEQEQDVVTEEQLSKALTEIDVLNAEEKDVYRIDSETFKFSNVEYKLIENHKDAFDIDLMEKRYTDYLLKYDYIVGDMSYQKLRLRGFYDNQRKGVPIDMKISNLEDYLVEYCSFGCQYFVFERVEKKEADPEPYFKQKKSNRPNQRRQNNKRQQSNQKNKNNQQKQGNKSTQKKEQPKKQQQQSKPTKNQKNFQVTKKEKQDVAPKANQKTQEKAPQKSNQKQNKSFEIRKKKD